MKHITITYETNEEGQPVYNSSGNMTLNEVAEALVTLAFIGGVRQAQNEVKKSNNGEDNNDRLNDN